MIKRLCDRTFLAEIARTLYMLNENMHAKVSMKNMVNSGMETFCLITMQLHLIQLKLESFFSQPR